MPESSDKNIFCAASPIPGSPLPVRASSFPRQSCFTQSAPMRLKTTFLIYPAPSPLQPARLLTPFHSLPCGNLSESTTMNTLRNLCRKSFLQPLRMAPCQYSPDIYRQILRIPKISRPCIPSGRQNTSAQLLTLNVAQKFRFRAGTDILRRYRPGGTTRKHVADAAKEPPRPSGFCPYPQTPPEPENSTGTILSPVNKSIRDGAYQPAAQIRIPVDKNDPGTGRPFARTFCS